MTITEQEKALIEARRLLPEAGHELFIFAYGSLMWRPGFPFLEIEPATLYGYHRAFCVTSTHYRGTAERPGLVLGLDRGGKCIGRLYRIAAKDAGEVAEYLHQRELVTSCYEPKRVALHLSEGRRQAGIAYVADRSHYQYAGKLSDKDVAQVIRHAAGVNGSNRDYLRNTVLHLEDMGIADGRLHRILKLLEIPE